MAAGDPWIIRQVDVPFLHRFEREYRDEVVHALGHGIDVPGGPRNGLSEHSTLQVEDPCRHVACLPYRRTECGPDQRLSLLFDDGQQAVPHYLELDAGQAAALAHC